MSDVSLEKLVVLRSSIEQLETSIIITDSEGIIEYVNPFFAENTGFSAEEAIGNTPSILNSGLQSKELYADLWSTIESGQTWNGELLNRKKNGELFWERVSISPVRDETHSVTQFIAVYQDIGKQKRTELELERRERLLNSIEKINKTGGWEIDINTGEIFWTDELFNIHAFEKNGDIDFISESLKCYHSDDIKIVREAFNEVIETGKGFDLTLRFKDANENKKWIRTITESLRAEDGSISKIIGSVKDVTDEIEQKDELKETRIRLEYALAGTRAGYWDWDIKNESLVLNERWATMLGYTLEELSPVSLSTWERLTHPKDFEKAQKLIEKCFSGENSVYETNLRMKHKNGEWRWISDRGAVFGRDKYGLPVRMVGTHIDITDWVHDRQKVEASEKRYRTLFEESSDANLLEQEGYIVDCNMAAVQILGYQSKEELIGKMVSEISHQETNRELNEQVFDHMKEQTKQQGHVRFEWKHIKKDGTVFPVEIMLTNLDDKEYKDTRYVVFRDLTKRKEAEDALMKSYEERGLLLGEIHHRVKNNLAIISGLVQLQMFKSQNKNDIQLLSKTTNRIQSIALIHEQLYQSENFANISLAENITKQIEFIRNMYDTESREVHTDLDLDDVKVDIDLAIPVGLLINEILNNAYKYAFIGRTEGTISVSLKNHKGQIHLIIKDDGVGMNPEEHDRESTLGTTLIENLLKQMEAEVEMQTKNGVSYDIIFANN